MEQLSGLNANENSPCLNTNFSLGYDLSIFPNQTKIGERKTQRFKLEVCLAGLKEEVVEKGDQFSFPPTRKRIDGEKNNEQQRQAI